MYRSQKIVSIQIYYFSQFFHYCKHLAAPDEEYYPIFLGESDISFLICSRSSVFILTTIGYIFCSIDPNRLRFLYTRQFQEYLPFFPLFPQIQMKIPMLPKSDQSKIVFMASEKSLYRALETNSHFRDKILLSSAWQYQDLEII